MDSGTRKGPEPWEGRNKARWLILKPFRLNSSKFPKLNQGRWWRERERENMKETQNKPRKPSATAASLLVAICCYLLLFLARLKCPSLSILKWGSGPRWAWRWKHPPSDSPRGSWTVTWLVLVHHGSTMFHYFHSCWKHKWYKCECYVLLVQHFTSRPEGRWRDNRNSFRRLLYPLPCLKLIHCRLFPPCQSQSTSVGEPYTWTLENWGGPWLLLGRQYWGRSCMIQLVHRVLFDRSLCLKRELSDLAIGLTCLVRECTAGSGSLLRDLFVGLRRSCIIMASLLITAQAHQNQLDTLSTTLLSSLSSP